MELISLRVYLNSRAAIYREPRTSVSALEDNSVPSAKSAVNSYTRIIKLEKFITALVYSAIKAYRISVNGVIAAFTVSRFNVGR